MLITENSCLIADGVLKGMGVKCKRQGALLIELHVLLRRVLKRSTMSHPSTGILFGTKLWTTNVFKLKNEEREKRQKEIPSEVLSREQVQRQKISTNYYSITWKGDTVQEIEDSAGKGRCLPDQLQLAVLPLLPRRSYQPP